MNMGVMQIAERDDWCDKNGINLTHVELNVIKCD